MQTNWKLRLVSIFLAVSLVIGMAPVTAKASDVLHITCYKDAVFNDNKLCKKEIKPQVSFKKNRPYYKDLKWMISEWYTNISGSINYLKLKLEIPESIQEEYYLDEVQMNAGSNDKKGTFTRSVTVSPDMMNTSTEIEMEIYQSDKKKTPPGGLNIDPIFKKNQATYALYNQPITDNKIVDTDGSWMSLWNQTDIQGVSRNLHATTQSGESVWNEPDSDGGIRCMNQGIIEKARYGVMSLSDLENAITEELKKEAEKENNKLNPSFIEPLKSGKIVAKVNRLSNCVDSVHVDFGMWDIAKKDWFDNEYKVNFEVQDQYKSLISFKDFFGDHARKLLENPNLVYNYGEGIELPKASGDAKVEGKKYKFLGWKTKKDTGNFINLNQYYRITEDTTFVAYFEEIEPKTFTVTYNGDSFGHYCFENWPYASEKISEKYPEGATIKLLSPKDSPFLYGNSYYYFEYWIDNNGRSYMANREVTVNSDLYYTAYYREESRPTPQLETCTIKYEMQEGFGNLKNVFFKNVPLTDKTVDKDVLLPSTPQPINTVETIGGVKYTFEGWKLKGDNGSLEDLPTYVSSDITLVAVFNKEDVTTKPADPTNPEDPKPGTDPINPPADPANPADPAPNADPSTPPVIIEPIDNPVVIPEEEAPLAEVIEEEDTPLSAPIEEEEAVLEEDEEEPVAEVVAEDVEIEDEAAPLSDMPKTREVNYLSGLTMAVVGITALGALLLLAGKIFRRR